jgi:hypothetical protein
MRDQQLAHRMLPSSPLDDNVLYSKLHAPRTVSERLVLLYTALNSPKKRRTIAWHWQPFLIS